MGFKLPAILLAFLCTYAPIASASADACASPPGILSVVIQRKQEEGARKPKPDGPVAHAGKEVLKAQAVQVLRDVIERSPAIPELTARAQVVSSAAELLWDYDEDYARLSILKSLDELIGLYEKGASATEGAASSEEVSPAVNTLLKALARKAPDLAERTLERYHKAKEEALKSDVSPTGLLSERFSLAKESVGVSTRRSAELAAKMLDLRVPISFPQYLYDLRAQDGATADSLYRKSLAVLGAGRPYSAGEAVLLSTYAFRERMVILPIHAPGDGHAQGVEFGIFTTPLAPPRGAVDRALAREYLAAAYTYVTLQIAPGSPKSSNPAFLGQCFFLVRKLRLYAGSLGLGRQGDWQQLEYGVGVLSRNAGVDQAALDNLGGFAQRLVADRDVFQFDGGASAFEQAAKTADKEKRIELLVKGVWSLIQERRFLEAEVRIKDLETPALRERLTNVLGYSAGEAAIAKGAWDEAARHVAVISDAGIRLLLLLDAARAATSARRADPAIASQYLTDALNLVPKLEKSEHKAKGLLAIASLLSAVDPQWSQELLVKAKQEINNSETYDRGNIEIDVALPGMVVPLVLTESNLDACIQRLAKADWASVRGVAREFNSEVTRSLAQVALCRAVL